jgi:homoserine kinase type II
MAVYTQLANEEIATLVEQTYGLGRLNFAVGIAQGVENSNYLLSVEGSENPEEKYILTLYEKRVALQDVPFFLELMQYLAGQRIACPQPIKRADGALFGEVAGRPAAMVSFLHGKSRMRLEVPHCASMGGTIASLHQAVQGFSQRRANTLSLEGWQTLFAKIETRIDEIQGGLRQLVAHELGYLQEHWPTVEALPRGIVHADLFPDNVFFEGDDVSGVIDFYFACEDAFAYDLIITMNAWCFEKSGEFNRTKARAMMQHYQQRRPLSDAEKKALPLLARGAALRFFLTRAHDWLFHEKSALVTPKDPMEYAAKLRFHQQVKDASEYGV